MESKKENKNRRSIRLANWEYSWSGYYFVTICAAKGELLFGNIEDEKMILNDVGRIVGDVWNEIPKHFSGVELDVFVVMPNHVHGVIAIVDGRDGVENSRDVVGARHASPLRPCGVAPRSLGSIVGSFKSAVTKRVNENRGTPGVPVWQRNYYEHVIRDEGDLERIREYIANNPLRWALDEEKPENRVS